MAFDPNDPADKKILSDAVATALTTQAEEHEAEIGGLRNKNKELLAKLKTGAEGDPAEVAKLEADLDAANKQLKELNKSLKSVTTERDEVKSLHETESQFTQRLLVDNGLTEQLVKANVAPAFLPAVKALLAPQVVIKSDGSERKALVGDKPLADFITAWSQGDEGKNYIAAANSGGGGAPGGKANGQGGKSMTRAAYDEMVAQNPQAVGPFFAGGGAITD